MAQGSLVDPVFVNVFQDLSGCHVFSLMEIKKKNDDSYDTYTMVVSHLELKTFADALTRGGVGPVADEMRRSIEWHMDRVPKPGQTKDEFDAEKEARKAIGEPEGEDGAEVDVKIDEPGAKPGEEMVNDGDAPASPPAPGPERTDVDIEADKLLPEPT